MAEFGRAPFAVPAPQQSRTQRIGEALMGFGAGFEGRGQEFLSARDARQQRPSNGLPMRGALLKRKPVTQEEASMLEETTVMYLHNSLAWWCLHPFHRMLLHNAISQGATTASLMISYEENVGGRAVEKMYDDELLLGKWILWRYEHERGKQSQ